MMEYGTSNNACCEPVEKRASIAEMMESLEKISLEMSLSLNELAKRMTGTNGPAAKEFGPAPLVDRLIMLRDSNLDCLNGIRFILDVVGQ